VHLVHDPFRFRVYALGAAVVERQGHGRADGFFVEVEAAGGGLKVRQVNGTDRGGPLLEALGVSPRAA
jgi:hypothetical protein